LTASHARARCVLAGAAALVAACAFSPAVKAQDANQERVAETLFQEGRSLMAAGKFSEACPKFAASQKASPSTGTLLNLADCYEKSGATASAWALYLDVARAALKEGRKDRETIAKTRAAALEPHLSRMKIVVPSSGVEVRRNGAVVDPALLGSEEPVDPGSYTLEVSAKGKKTWSQAVTVAAGAPTVVVTVPELADDTTAAAPAAPPTAAPAPTSAPQGDMSTAPAGEAPEASRSSPLRTVGLVVGGVGVVGLGVGTAFGVIAMSKQSSANCPKNVCPNAGAAQTIRDAEGAGTISTIAFAAGGALVATGIVLWFVAPKSESSSSAASVQLSPSVGLGSAGLQLRGAF
jgi:hypothetical protein